jgi:hypothetical protein
MDGLSNLLNKSNIGCCINGKVINHLLYADDSCIIASTPAALQKLLKLCCEYADDNTIIYNENKTKCMCFKPKSLNNLFVPSLFLNSVKLKFVSTLKYLGVMLSHDLHDDEDLGRHRRYLYAKGNMLIKNFQECSDEVKYHLFKTFCHNVYGGHLWTVYKAQSMNKLNVAFNNVYRTLFHIKRGTSMSSLYVHNNIDSFTILLRKAAFSFRNRLLTSLNNYVMLIVSSVYFYCHSSFTINWARNLFTYL